MDCTEEYCRWRPLLEEGEEGGEEEELVAPSSPEETDEMKGEEDGKETEPVAPIAPEETAEMEGEEDGEEEELVAPTSPEVLENCHLEIRAGHNGAQTLTIESSGGDKAQVLEVGLKAAEGLDYTPHQVVALVKRALKGRAEKLLPPCRKAEWLEDFRTLARAEKKNILRR